MEVSLYFNLPKPLCQINFGCVNKALRISWFLMHDFLNMEFTFKHGIYRNYTKTRVNSCIPGSGRDN